MLVIPGRSHPALAEHIALDLGVESLTPEWQRFANGEQKVRVSEQVRGETVILVQSLVAPVDEHLLEYLLLSDALERAGAREVIGVIPWLGYSLQDKVFKPGESLSAKVVANIISASYTHHVILLDLHNASVAGFFDIPTTHLSALPVFLPPLKVLQNSTELAIASPDFGGMKKARSFADALELPLISIEKYRDLTSGAIEARQVHGPVEGKTVVIVDDVIQSGGTAVAAAELLLESGASAVHFYATHGLFVGDAAEKFAKSKLASVVVTDSCPAQASILGLKIESVSQLVANAVQSLID